MAVDVLIEFWKSPSPRYQRTIETASKIHGYSFDGRIHSVKTTATPANWPAIRELWDELWSLRTARCIVDGQAWHWRRWHEIDSTLSCFIDREKSGLGDRYCVGQESPSDDPQYFGCRLAGGARLSYNPNRLRLEQLPDWWKFGTLDPDRKSFLVDKEEILRLVELHSVTARECGAWSMDRVRAAVKMLPTALLVGEDWKLRYSELDPSRAVGVQPAGPIMGGTFRLEEAEPDQEDL